MLAHELKHLSCAVPEGSRLLFEDLSLTIVPGKISKLCGASGAGKSSLLKLLAGGVALGQAFTVSGQVIWKRTQSQRKPRIAWMNQEPRLQVIMPTVESEIAFSLGSAARSRAGITDVIRDLSDRYGVQHLLDRPFSNLSNGELQRAVLASLLAMEPEVLLLDEPFSHQSNDSCARLRHQLRQDVQRLEIATLVADHVSDENHNWADEVVYLPELRDLAPVWKVERGELVPSLMTTCSRDALPELVRGINVECQRAAAVGERSIFNSLFMPCSFTVGVGEVLAFSGDNGVGKSTLLRAIARNPRAERGLRVSGELILSEDAAARAFFACDLRHYLFADSVIAEIQESRQEVLARRQVLLRRFGLSTLGATSPRSLSVGERQRLVLSLLLAEQPRLLILDEPTRALDRGSKNILIDILLQLTNTAECGVILATHDQELIGALEATECQLELATARNGWRH